MNRAISAQNLYATLGLPTAPTLIALCDAAALPRLIPGSIGRPVTQLASWAKTLPAERTAVVYAASERAGREGAEKLAAIGLAAAWLEGGIESWHASKFATVRTRPELGVPGASRWITRERPKIDRLACPWLVRRFIDPDALFFYTDAHRVRAQADALGAQPYDIVDVPFSHHGPACSFDAFLREFDLSEPALDELARIVRAADTGELALSPQAPGLLAISLGLSANVSDDVLLLEQAIPVYDALYAFCKTARKETHAWPQSSPRTPAP